MNTHNTTTATATMPSPWSRPPRRTYEDLILKSEYEDRKLQVPAGQTWIRIVSKAEESILPTWMMPVHALGFKDGKFAHPKSLQRNSKSVYDHAYGWLKQHKPEMLFSKQNPSGARLLADPIAVFWVIVDLGKGPVVRIFQGSAYGGERGGAAGLGYEIWKLACAHATSPGKYAPDAGDPIEGVQLCIEKVQSPGSKFPSYRLHRGNVAAPMDEIMPLLPAEELAVICPIEQTVRELSHEEQWKRLSTILPTEIVQEICLAID